VSSEGAVGYSQLYRGIQGFSSTGGSETPKLKELKPSFQRYRGLISAVLGPLGPKITIYIGTSHRRSNGSSLNCNRLVLLEGISKKQTLDIVAV
jgi:hypothetical protein